MNPLPTQKYQEILHRKNVLWTSLGQREGLGASYPAAAPACSPAQAVPRFPAVPPTAPDRRASLLPHLPWLPGSWKKIKGCAQEGRINK